MNPFREKHLPQYLICNLSRDKFIVATLEEEQKSILLSWSENRNEATFFLSIADAVIFEDQIEHDILFQSYEPTTVVYSATLDSVFP